MIFHTGEVEKINAFVKDLRDVLEKHNVWMDSGQCSLAVDGPVVTFTSEKDITDPEGEVDWLIEMVDMWPQDYCIAKSKHEIERIGGPEDGQIRSNKLPNWE